MLQLLSHLESFDLKPPSFGYTIIFYVISRISEEILVLPNKNRKIMHSLFLMVCEQGRVPKSVSNNVCSI